MRASRRRGLNQLERVPATAFEVVQTLQIIH